MEIDQLRKRACTIIGIDETAVKQGRFILLELIMGVRDTVVFLSITLHCVYGIECIKCGLDTGYAP